MESDFFELSREEMQKYFVKLNKIFSVLLTLYSSLNRGTQSYESQIVLQVLKRLAHTKETLYFQYMFDHDNTPKIDGIDSGFMDAYLLEKMLGEVTIAESKLANLHSKSALLNKLGDKLFSGSNADQSTIDELAMREYYTRLTEPNELIFGFTMGDIKKHVSTDGQPEHYSTWWATFDREENRPFVYLMDFEVSNDWLDSEDAEQQFFKTVAFEGNTSKELRNIGVQLDAMLDNIHPKLLKRIGFTLYSKAFSKELSEYFDELFEHGEPGEQFCLLVENELLLSKQQTRQSNLFSKQIREVFYIPSGINEQSERGVSHIDKWLIMPYRLHQHAQNILPNGYRIHSFDSEGGLHESTH